MTFKEPIPLGVSACLVGENVRYDGGHRADLFVTEKLSPAFELVPVCPEIFLGAPRAPINLYRVNGVVRAIPDTEEKADVTDKIASYASATPNVCGYVLKSRSPSCAVDSAIVGGGEKGEMASGVFTAEIIKNDPLTPLIEEESLKTPERLDSFIEQVVANAGWKAIMENKNQSSKSLALFHKALTPGWEGRGDAVSELQKIVTLVEVDDADFVHVTFRYRILYMETTRCLLLSRKERAGLFGHASSELSDLAKQEFCDAITAYEKGKALLSLPLTIFAKALLSDDRGR